MPEWIDIAVCVCTCFVREMHFVSFGDPGKLSGRFRRCRATGIEARNARQVAARPSSTHFTDPEDLVLLLLWALVIAGARAS